MAAREVFSRPELWTWPIRIIMVERPPYLDSCCNRHPRSYAYSRTSPLLLNFSFHGAGKGLEWSSMIEISTVSWAIAKGGRGCWQRWRVILDSRAGSCTAIVVRFLFT